MQCYWLSRLVVIEGFEFECINEVVDVYIAINRRACVVPAKDVPDRRPRRNCNCWFDLGCSCIEVGSNGLTVYLHVVVTHRLFFFLAISCDNKPCRPGCFSIVLCLSIVL